MERELKKTPQKAIETLRRTCSKMERAESDIRGSLYRWGVDPQAWGMIIESLKKDSFVDENRYAACYIRDKVSNSTWGERKIKMALSRKSIPKEIIDAAWQEFGIKDPSHRLSEQIAKKHAQLSLKPHKSEYELRQKLFAWGASRGYDFDQINQALENCFKVDED